jgi:hypothetical protein
VVLGKVEHELADARPKLVGEVLSRGTDEPVDILAGRLRHAEKPTG